MIERFKGMKRVLSTLSAELVKPSLLSIWISEQTQIPFRRKLANLIEDAKCSALVPFVLARGLTKNMSGVEAAVLVGGFPVVVALSTAYLAVNPLVDVTAGIAMYMAEGYALYRPRAAHIAANYRQALNSP